MKNAAHNTVANGSDVRETDAGVQQVPPRESAPVLEADLTMFRTDLGLGITAFILALAAGLFGFGIVSSEAWLLAKIFFFIFLAISVATLVEEFFFSRRTA